MSDWMRVYVEGLDEEEKADFEDIVRKLNSWCKDKNVKKLSKVIDLFIEHSQGKNGLSLDDVENALIREHRMKEYEVFDEESGLVERYFKRVLRFIDTDQEDLAIAAYERAKNKLNNTEMLRLRKKFKTEMGFDPDKWYKERNKK